MTLCQATHSGNRNLENVLDNAVTAKVSFTLLQLRHPNSKINLISGKAELPFLFVIRVSSIYGTADANIQTGLCHHYISFIYAILHTSLKSWTGKLKELSVLTREMAWLRRNRSNSYRKTCRYWKFFIRHYMEPSQVSTRASMECLKYTERTAKDCLRIKFAVFSLPSYSIQAVLLS